MIAPNVRNRFLPYSGMISVRTASAERRRLAAGEEKPMSDLDPRLRHLLVVMGVSSAVADAFIVAARERDWPQPDQARTKEAFAVIGPLMLSGLPEREVIEQLE